MEKGNDKRDERPWVPTVASSTSELQVGLPCRASWVDRGGLAVGVGAGLREVPTVNWEKPLYHPSNERLLQG